MNIRELESFEPEKYKDIDLDRLVMYTAVRLDNLGIELSLENIIVGSYRLFPKKFSLFGYPEYPDATRVEKALWRCNKKNRRWIGGKTKLGYTVINRTRVIAEKIAKQLSVSTPKMDTDKTSTSRRRKVSIIRDMENSSAYKKYNNDDIELISWADFCYLLQGTLDSSIETLQGNLDALNSIIDQVDREDLKKFIQTLEDKFFDKLYS